MGAAGSGCLRRGRCPPSPPTRGRRGAAPRPTRRCTAAPILWLVACRVWPVLCHRHRLCARGWRQSEDRTPASVASSPPPPPPEPPEPPPAESGQIGVARPARNGPLCLALCARPTECFRMRERLRGRCDMGCQNHLHKTDTRALCTVRRVERAERESSTQRPSARVPERDRGPRPARGARVHVVYTLFGYSVPLLSVSRVTRPPPEACGGHPRRRTPMRLRSVRSAGAGPQLRSQPANARGDMSSACTIVPVDAGRPRARRKQPRRAARSPTTAGPAQRPGRGARSGRHQTG